MALLKTSALLLSLPMAATAAPAAAPSSVAVTVADSGTYTVSVAGKQWFSSGSTSYTTGGKTLSTSDGTLVLSSSKPISGHDSLGPFTGTALSWDSGNYVTTFRQYADAVVFEQSFPHGVTNTSLNSKNPMSARDMVSTSFPTLVPASADSLGFLAFSGDMTGSNYKYGTLSSNSSAMRAADPIGTCRITLNSSTLHSSGAGYSAWTPAPGSNPPIYTEHPGDFCDCEGDGDCSKWAFHSTSMTFADCEAKCTTMKCECFDFSTGDKSEGGLPTGVTGFGPAGIFTKDLKSSIVISSFSEFMAASAAKEGSGVKYGLQGSFTEIPVGFSLSYIIAASPNGGVNSAFESWGDKLLTTYGKSREMTYRDYSLNYLGYSTDNGAFYYYQTEDHQPGKRGPPYTPGKTYEETLIDVKNYADSVGIPYKYVLLDSWWYYQGQGSGVTNWIGRPDVFPHGNDYLRNQTGWPIMGHNRFWAVDNVYATQNGGQYDFVVEKKGQGTGFNNYAWPMTQRFWDDLMYNSSKWGLFMYEQDWLDTEYDNVVHLNVNVTAARTWLLQMGTAAARNDLTIQYCMSHCRHIMQSVEIPAVTNARASGDYHAGSDQWKPLGTTGIFAWSVAIGPTKDNYWSTDVQTGSAYGDYATIKEPYNRLQAVVSTISKGPVAPSDKIGSSNVELILRSCAKDGKLLAGDKPAMQLDKIHVHNAFGDGIKQPQPPAPSLEGDFSAAARKAQLTDSKSVAGAEVWAAHTNLDGYVYAVVMGATMDDDLDVSFAQDLALTGSSYIAYETNTTSSLLVGSSSVTMKACPSKWDFQLYAIAPVLPNGWAFLGEPDKWVAVSSARFSKLSYFTEGSTTGASVVARGPEGEVINVQWVAPGSKKPTAVSCTVGQSSTVRISVETGSAPSCEAL